MKIKDIMTKNVKTAAPETSLEEVARLMRGHSIGSIPVMKGEQLVGFVTDRDMVTRALTEGLDPRTTPIGEIMTPHVFHVSEEQDVQEAAWLMEIKRVRRLVVLDAKGRLTGLLALSDISGQLEDRDLAGEVLEHVTRENATTIRL